MIMTKQVKVTLIKSRFGRHPKHRAIIKQLGLGKINSSAIHPDLPSTHGLINIVGYLLRVEEC